MTTNTSSAEQLAYFKRSRHGARLSRLCLAYGRLVISTGQYTTGKGTLEKRLTLGVHTKEDGSGVSVYHNLEIQAGDLQRLADAIARLRQEATAS